MEWMKRLNQAVSYIEEHLTEEIDYEELAKIACCSTYHFQRMFSYIADVTLSEYIRRRRMSMAAAELSTGKEKIVDIALKYGYDSPTAFNRAFQSVHHTAPSAARKNGIILKSYPPISFQITIKGDAEMNYRIETKESFRIIGPSAPMHKDVEKNFQMVPGLWTKAAADGSVQKLVSKIGKEPQGILGVSACDDKSEQFQAMIPQKKAGMNIWFRLPPGQSLKEKVPCRNRFSSWKRGSGRNGCRTQDMSLGKRRTLRYT